MTRTAVVTGSAGVIGAATCRALVAEGYRVIGFDREPADTDRQHRQHVRVDLTDAGAVAAAFTQVEGQVDVLVNNAGQYLGVDTRATTPEQFDQVMAANVRSTFLCSQQFAECVIAAGTQGVIVNVASVSGRTGSADGAYAASKGAVIALTKSLGGSLAPHGIRVNAVAPGVIDSDMSARIPADRQADYLATIPLGRFGTPDEIAAVVLFLAGEASGYLTRAVVDANGGLW